MTDDGPVTDGDLTTAADLEGLVGSWLPLPDVAERLGIAVTAVRRLVEERELLAARIGDRRILAVPAAFFVGGETHPHLKGTFVVLGDGGMKDDEILQWLFTPDDTLPVSGTPMDALHAGFKTEVRRRAMETAW